MKNIQIKASQFFETLKTHDASMWEVFSQMIDGEKKEIIFLDDAEQILFSYELPETLEQLQSDQKIFAKEYAEKIAAMN